MSPEGVCHCGHERYLHVRVCNGAVPEDHTSPIKAVQFGMCPCPGFDDSVLPAAGERLEFGKHRQPAPSAETAPAWPPLGSKS